MPMRCNRQSWLSIEYVQQPVGSFDLRDQVMDVGLVQLTYGMDYGPPVNDTNDTKWTKPKIQTDQIKNLGKNLTRFGLVQVYRKIENRTFTIVRGCKLDLHK